MCKRPTPQSLPALVTKVPLNASILFAGDSLLTTTLPDANEALAAKHFRVGLDQ